MKDTKERRLDPRFHVGECGYLEARGGVIPAGRQEVYVSDISRGGLGVHVDSPIPVGTPVTVSLSKCRIAGVVAHCRPDEVGFIAGVKANKAADHVEKLKVKAVFQPSVPQSPPEVTVSERVTFLGIRVRRRSPVR